MAGALRRLLLGLALWLCAAGLAIAGGPEAPPSGGEIARQVLVLIRLPPDHARPGADYGASYGEGLGHAARRRIADGVARRHGLRLVTDWAMPAVGVDCYVMAVPDGQSPQAVAASLSRDPGVAWAEPMSIYHAEGGPAEPNDPLYRAQPAASEWRLSDLHQVATGRNVRVAVIDSMVEAGHPDLAGQVQTLQDFVAGRASRAEAHGTGVAGIIAARADNGVGIVGVAPEARLMALRACWQEGAEASSTVCDSLSLAKALYFALTHDAQIINLSLSGPYDPLLGRLIEAARRRGVTVVGAYDRKLPSGGFPASEPGVVAVAEESAEPLPKGVFAAPGRDVPTTEPGGRWYLVSGSSYAAAHVSGLLALVREKAPRAEGASMLVAAWPGGVIDTCATLLRMSGPCDCSCAYARGYSTVARR